MSIREVALACGFSYPSVFSRASRAEQREAVAAAGDPPAGGGSARLSRNALSSRYLTI